MINQSVHKLWLASASKGQPPDPATVAKLQYGMKISWWHEEAILNDLRQFPWRDNSKRVFYIEASRGLGKSFICNFVRLYLSEYILPFLKDAEGQPYPIENMRYLIFGRSEDHLKDDTIQKLKDTIYQYAPWLRCKDWEERLAAVDGDPQGAFQNLASKGGQKWEALRLDLTNGVSFRGISVRQSPRGQHGFCGDSDDILTESNVGDSAEIVEFYEAAVKYALMFGSIFVLWGTPRGPGDTGDRMKGKSSVIYRAFPALDLHGDLGYAEKNRKFYGKDNKFSEDDLKSCWPPQLPFLAVMAEKGTTPEEDATWRRERQLERIVDSTRLIPEDYLHLARDPNLSYHYGAAKGTYYYGGHDPSARKKDAAAFCIGYVTPEAIRIPAHFKALSADPRMGPGEGELSVADELSALDTQFANPEWVVEGNGFQGILAALARRISKNFRATTLFLGANKHTEAGWLGLRTVFRSRQIKFPYKTAEDRATTDAVFHQLRALQYIDGKVVEDPTRLNDLVSALFLFVKATERVEAVRSAASITLPSAMPALPSLQFGASQRSGGEMGHLNSQHSREARLDRATRLSGNVRRRFL